jgi:hypothetical protein
MQLQAIARYADGSSRDVTADARYSSGNETTADVGENGLVRLRTRGESAIMVRYGSLVAVSNVVVSSTIRHSCGTARPRTTTSINSSMLAEADADPAVGVDHRRGVPRRVTTTCSDCRRRPTRCAFLADTRVDKRSRKIDELLERPEHADW